MKVAVASSDGIVINMHFGRADTFYIYECQDRNYQFLEKRRGIPFCSGGQHEDGQLLTAVELLSDCEKVYLLQIGKGAKDALLARGIQPVTARGIITEVLEGFEQSNKEGK